MGSICFQVRSMKKKEKYGKYSVEVPNEKYNAYYMESVSKLQYEFADVRINCFMW